MLESVEMARRQVAYPTTTEQLWSIFDAIEREVESNYVELPKDESGEHIHVGDLLTAAGYAGVHKAIYISYHHDGWILKTDVGAIARPEAYARLCHKPTVEDVLLELIGSVRPEMEDDEDLHDEAMSIVQKYAECLQLREGQ